MFSSDIDLFGWTIPTYYFVEALCFVGASLIIVGLLFLKFKIPFRKAIGIIAFCIPLPFFNVFFISFLEEGIRTGDFRFGGQNFFGFLIMFLPMALIAAKATKVSEKVIFSSFVPPIAFVGSLVKIGCLSAGCCKGVEIEGPGLHYPGEGVTRAPIEICEIVVLFLLFLVLLFIVLKSKKPTYAPFFILYFVFPIYRFIQDFWRIKPKYFFELNCYQVDAIVLMVLVLLTGLYLSREERLERSSNPETR